jgi:hypothetical protein
MSMQTLNQLVARSIVDPTVVQSFSSGSISEVLTDLNFSDDLQNQLGGLKADSWAEFAVMAYRTVREAEYVAPRIAFPSPLEGLLPGQQDAGEEQVA